MKTTTQRRTATRCMRSRIHKQTEEPTTTRNRGCEFHLQGKRHSKQHVASHAFVAWQLLMCLFAIRLTCVLQCSTAILLRLLSQMCVHRTCVFRVSCIAFGLRLLSHFYSVFNVLRLLSPFYIVFTVLRLSNLLLSRLQLSMSIILFMRPLVPGI